MRRFAISIVLALVALALLPGSALGGGWGWPLEGRVFAPFAQSSDPYASGDHRGVDIEAAEGTTVVAPISGKVRWTGTLGAGGKMVSLTSNSGLHVLSFLHLSKISVARGQAVMPGAKLGLSGSSGDLRGKPPHLHFGVRVPEGGELRYVDPLPLLSASGRVAAPLPQNASPHRQRKPVRSLPQAARPHQHRAMQSPAEHPAQQRSIRPAATKASRERQVSQSKPGRLERERAVEPVLTPKQLQPAVTKAPFSAVERLPDAARPSSRTPALIAIVATLALAGAAVWWWRRWTVAPVLPAQPPNVARLRSIDQPSPAPVRKAL